MAFENKKSPWNPGYAIPEYVLKEPAGRGTFTTRQLPRGTIDVLPKVPTAGYAIPANVQKEVPGMGTLTTAYTPRGSAFFRPADSLASSSLRPSAFSSNTLAKTSLSGSSLGDSTFGGSRSNENPFSIYGREVSNLIQAALKKAPPAQRADVLKAILDGVDPKLNAKVKEHERKGLPLDQAISKAFEEGFTQEIINLGQGKPPTKAKQIQNAARSRRGQPLSGYMAVGGLISGLTGLVTDTVNAIGSAGCKVAKNDATPIVAAGVSTAYGGGPQTGATGAVVARSLCSGGSGSGGSVPAYAPEPVPWHWIGLGFVALVGGVVLFRKKGQ